MRIPRFELVLVSSREHDGQQLSAHHRRWLFTGSLRYVCADAEAVPRKAADVVVLALPNGKSAEYVQAIQIAAAGSRDR
jgi:N-acetyl-gamma-glutamyl-phosphate reductase